MIDSNEVKIEVLQDLIDHMKRLEGGKMKPKEDVEISVSEMKPEGEADGEPKYNDAEDRLEAAGEMKPEGAGDDELSEEDAQMIEQLLAEQGD